MKGFIKKYLPKRVFPILRGLANRYWAQRAYRYDRRRFLSNYTHGGSSDDQVNVEAHVIFHTHQIEKGLSHVEFRDGFGEEALSDLRMSMERVTDHESTVYIAALSAVKAYIDIHERRRFDISKQLSILGNDIVSEAVACKSDVSGFYVINESSKIDNKNKNYKDLFDSRYALREFSDVPVSDEKVMEAIRISMKTPTVCNRQAGRVVIIKNQQKIEQALGVQNGFRGYALPPILAVILTDARSFRGVSERNNQYIDGGAFMMSFLLGLEYVGLAACPLNTMFSVKSDKATRKILDIDDNYNFISYVAIGNFRDENKAAKSFRFSPIEITRVIE